MQRKQHRRGFTLIEALLAAAIVGVAGYVLSLSFNNGQIALLNWESDREFEQFHHWAMVQIDFETLDLDALEAGDTIDSPDDLSLEWSGSATPTGILDLFVVEVRCTVTGRGNRLDEYVDQRIVSNQRFYDNDSDRERLVEQKKELFEAMQEARERL